MGTQNYFGKNLAKKTLRVNLQKNICMKIQRPPALWPGKRFLRVCETILEENLQKN